MRQVDMNPCGNDVDVAYRVAEGYSPLLEIFTPQEERRFIVKLAAIAAFIVGLGLAFFATTARSHEFYNSWLDKDGNSCCNTMDCRPTDERITQEGYEAKMGDKWIPIPSDRVLKQRSPDGRPHLCYNPQKGVLCFQPGLSA